MKINILKFWGIIFILSLLPVEGKSQIRDRLFFTDWEKFGLKGNVKEILHKEYKVRFSDDSTFTLELYDFILPSNFIYVFNRKGYLDKRKELRKRGDSIFVGSVMNYWYDEDNKILREQWMSTRQRADTLTWKFDYKGDTILIDNVGRGYTISIKDDEYEYIEYFSRDSILADRYIIVYDEKKRLTKMEIYSDKDCIQTIRMAFYKDDVSFKPHMEIFWFKEHHDPHIRTYEYDEFGNKTLMKIGVFEDESNSIRFEYDYDSKGNWNEKRHFGGDGKLLTVYTREIKYFDE